MFSKYPVSRSFADGDTIVRTLYTAIAHATHELKRTTSDGFTDDVSDVLRVVGYTRHYSGDSYVAQLLYDMMIIKFARLVERIECSLPEDSSYVDRLAVVANRTGVPLRVLHDVYTYSATLVNRDCSVEEILRLYWVMCARCGATVNHLSQLSYGGCVRCAHTAQCPRCSEPIVPHNSEGGTPDTRIMCPSCWTRLQYDESSGRYLPETAFVVPDAAFSPYNERHTDYGDKFRRIVHGEDGFPQFVISNSDMLTSFDQRLYYGDMAQVVRTTELFVPSEVRTEMVRWLRIAATCSPDSSCDHVAQDTLRHTVYEMMMRAFRRFVDALRGGVFDEVPFDEVLRYISYRSGVSEQVLRWMYDVGGSYEARVTPDDVCGNIVCVCGTRIYDVGELLAAGCRSCGGLRRCPACGRLSVPVNYRYGMVRFSCCGAIAVESSGWYAWIPSEQERWRTGWREVIACTPAVVRGLGESREEQRSERRQTVGVGRRAMVSDSVLGMWGRRFECGEWGKRSFSFGVELECSMSSTSMLRYLGWDVGEDPSIDRLPYPVELSAGPLLYDEFDKFMAESEKYLRGGRVNQSCGFHLHVGRPNGRFGWFEVYRLMVYHKLYEKWFYATQNESRRLSRFCRPMVVPVGVRTKDEFIKALYGSRSTAQRSRGLKYPCEGSVIRGRRWFNVQSWMLHGTVEVRLHSGTCAVQKVIMWKELFASTFEHALLVSPRKWRPPWEVAPNNVVKFYERRIETFGSGAAHQVSEYLRRDFVRCSDAYVAS